MTRPAKNLLLGSLVALIVLCVPGYFGWRFISIAWHRYEMSVAYWRIPRVERARADYEHHRAALIQLGYFVKRQFYLKRITTDSPDFRDLLNNLQTHFPTKIGKIEGHGYIYGEPPFLDRLVALNRLD